jgi:trk system potassium uptake protein
VKTVIVGCGRVGSVLADSYDKAGHEVIVIDTSTTAFDRLPGTFRGAAIRGDGTDEDTLRRAGATDADLFIAMTEGDNRNVMASQLAAEALGAKQVIAKLNDPLRAAAYAELGLATLCRTNLMAQAVSDFLGLGLTYGPGLSRATGQHPGGAHHGGDATGPAAPAAAAEPDEPAEPATIPPPGSAPALGSTPDFDSPNGSIPTQAASTTAREG